MIALRRACIALLAAVFGSLVVEGTSSADDDPPGTEAHGGAFWVHAGVTGPESGSQQQSASSGLGGTWHQEPACAIGGAETCAELAQCDDGSVLMYVWFQSDDGATFNHGTSCPQDGGEVASPEVTPGLVLRALRRIGLPESELMVQPPGGRTLVNFETNFYTESGEFTRTVTLLGQRVELRIWPSSFGWRFGDGASRVTASAGSPYPDLEITHRYLAKGRVAPSVDTTYAAEFRVNGGPWREVHGTVTIPGTPEGLRVVTARPVLVGG